MLLPPAQHTHGARIELVEVEGGPVERSRRRQRRERYGFEFGRGTEFGQSCAAYRGRVDARAGKRAKHLRVTLVEHRQSEVGNPTRLTSAGREL